MLLVILSSILFSLSQAQAAISPVTTDKKPFEVPFFKSKNSLFASGYTTLDNLKKQLVTTETAPVITYKWNNVTFAQNELKPLFATHLSKYVIEIRNKKRYKVIETTVQNLQLMDEENKTLKKSPVGEVHADPYDLGYVMSLQDAYLRRKASDRANVLTTIPQGTRLSVEKYYNKYAFVHYQNYEGYVSLSDLITKFDFSSFVFAENEWHQVSRRDYDKIITTKKVKVPLNLIKGVITPESRGIIASVSQKIPMWSQVEISQQKLGRWNQSQLKEHGPVWWQDNKDTEQTFYTIDELLKKDISSVSFHPQNPLKGILSSDGVYTTTDGFYWKKLDRFENFNGPVHYFNDLLLFVGNYRSTDGGATFDNYIQIDKLASAIEFQFGFFPKKLQVKRIETQLPLKLRIEIETGVRRIKMESPLFSQDWKATKG